MADDGAVGIVVAKNKLRYVPNVEIVREAVSRAIVGELAEFDQDRAISTVGQNSFLVVMEVAIPERQVAAFLPDSSSVQVDYRCAGELNILYRCVITRDNPNRLTLGAFASSVDHGTAGANSNQ